MIVASGGVLFLQPCLRHSHTRCRRWYITILSNYLWYFSNFRLLYYQSESKKELTHSVGVIAPANDWLNATSLINSLIEGDWNRIQLLMNLIHFFNLSRDLFLMIRPLQLFILILFLTSELLANWCIIYLIIAPISQIFRSSMLRAISYSFVFSLNLDNIYFRLFNFLLFKQKLAA